MANPVRWFQVEKLAGTLLEEGSLGARRVRMVIRKAGEEYVRAQGASTFA